MTGLIIFTVVVHLGIALGAAVYIYVGNKYIRPHLLKDTAAPVAKAKLAERPSMTPPTDQPPGETAQG